MAANIVPGFGAHDLSVLIDFLLFGATLACVAIFHRHTLSVALIGLGTITLKKFLGTGFNEGAGFPGLFAHFANEWVLLANLFLLLVGFALLARHFEASRVPDWMPAALSDNWTGGFVLLTLVFVLSSFLDKPLDHGGLALSRPIASAVIAVIMIGCILLFPQRAGRALSE